MSATVCNHGGMLMGVEGLPVSRCNGRLRGLDIGTKDFDR